MKPPTLAPVYVGLYPILCEVTREHGYALAVHGTVSNDFDLVAVPWVDTAVDADTLIRKILERIDWARDTAYSADRLFEPPFVEQKPLGRRSWCIPLYGEARLDISVTPKG